ncbi:MAG TPA: transporter substrate-binding domain-containing protein [Thermohalobaculum sp.]|nr:transporter substrate-binding domain-containing protein [Thermohalobaculum sp.]
MDMDRVRAQLAPTGSLRAGVNLGNILLVTGKTPAGDPEGVSPDMAAAIAKRLGVPLTLVPYASPGAVADALARDEWDIGLIAYEPERARTIAFAPAYVEIEATYLVPAGSDIRTLAEVDRPGIRIAVSDRSAYDLYLTRHLKHAELCRRPGLAGAFKRFADEGLEALAGLRPALIDDAARLPGSRVLEGGFTAVGQAVGSKPGNPEALAFLTAFVGEARQSGLVARLIDRHGVTGRLQVASAP